MIEELTARAWSQCLHCGREITQYAAGLLSEPFWTHDETGRPECPESSYATPWS